MYSKERKRFPQELFLPGFPTRDNLTLGTEDSYTTSHHPAPRPFKAAFSYLNLFFPIIDMPKPHRHADEYTAQDIPNGDRD